MRYIFLDIDGVLNNTESRAKFGQVADFSYACMDKRPQVREKNNFNQDCVDRLRKLVEMFPSKIVISSMWRYWGEPKNFQELFALYGLNLAVEDIDTIDRNVHENPHVDANREKTGLSRYELIQQYLVKNCTNGCKYVMIDDILENYPNIDTPNLILTTMDSGFAQEHFDKCLKIFEE
jgi:hypothetical protein